MQDGQENVGDASKPPEQKQTDINAEQKKKEYDNESNQGNTSEDVGGQRE